MNRLHPFALVSVATFFSFCLMAGCSKSPSGETGTKSAASAESPNTEAVTQAATAFVDAVVKGDAARANSCLTPQAVKQTVEGGTPFNPPGWENTTFQIGDIRTPEVDKALVRCILVCNTPGDVHNEELYCLLKKVENSWLVSGIAFRNEKFPNGNLLDFETGQMTPIPPLPAAPNVTGPGNMSQPGAQPLPPRMAQEAEATTAR